MQRSAFALVLLLLLALATVFMMRPWGDADAWSAISAAGPGSAAPIAVSGIAAATAGTARGDAPGEDAATRASLAPAADGRVRLTGRLVEADGAPCAGQTVGFWPGRGNAAGLQGFFPVWQVSGGQRAPTATAQSAADGTFSLVVGVNTAGRLDLVASEFVWEKAMPDVLGTATDLDVGPLAVHRGSVLRGRVRDQAGAALPGAVVQAHEFRPFSPPLQAEVDAKGAYELRGLRSGTVRIEFRAPEHVSCHLSVDLAPEECIDDFDAALRRGASLSGLVTDDRSRPLSGATVRVQGRRIEVENGYEDSSWSAETDDQGRFSFAGLGTGPYRVRGSAAKHAPATRTSVEPGPDPIRLELERRGSVSGRVVDENGRGCAASRVQAMTRPPDPARRNVPAPANQPFLSMVQEGHSMPMGKGVETDVEGRFRIDGLAAGAYWVFATGSHEPASIGPLTVVAGEDCGGVSLQTRRGGVIRVEVVDPDGAAVQAAQLVAYEPASAAAAATPAASRRGSIEWSFAGGLGSSSPRGKRRALARGQTDGSGTCELIGLPSGEFEVEARHPEWVAPALLQVAVSDARPAVVRFVMVRGGELAIRVVDHRGARLPHQAFRVLRDDDHVAGGQTDVTGRGRHAPLAPGSYEVVLERRPVGMGSSFFGMTSSVNAKEIGKRVRFEIVAGKTTEVELERPELAVLRGTLRDGDGLVAGARLILTPKAESGAAAHHAWLGTVRTRSTPEGTYEFDGLEAGVYTLFVRRRTADDPFTHELRLGATGEHREDLFLATGWLTVRLTEAGEGEPVGGVAVQLARAGQRSSRGAKAQPRSDGDGVVQLRDIPPGAYELKINDADWVAPELAPVTITANGGERVEVALTRAGSLTFSIRQKEGGPAAATDLCLLKLVRLDGERRHAVGGGNRWFRGASHAVKSLVPGRYEVQVRRQRGPSGPWSEKRTVEVVAGEDRKVEVELP